MVSRVRGILITTQDSFAEHTIIETVGLVRGNSIRARHLGIDILATLRTWWVESSPNTPRCSRNPGSSRSIG